MRAFVRARETGIALAALVIGAASGVLVAGMSQISQYVHILLFGLDMDERLSIASRVDWFRAFPALIGGGLLIWLLGRLAGRRLEGRLFDAIEANALHGGRLSLPGSLYITVQTMISNGCGASVGLEAAYTQICSAVASFIGRGLAARRADMRLLVGCGAAGAIAAAFGAPLAGAFYAFEVVLGAYSVASLVPVVASAVVGSSVAGILAEHVYLITPGKLETVSGLQFGHVLAIAGFCTAASVALMQAVAKAESIFAAKRLSPISRLVIGGAIVAALGLVTPQVLGAGHGALQLDLIERLPLRWLLLIIALKSLASSISLGAGFRGGLFFASLLLGALIGLSYSAALGMVSPFHFDPVMAAIAGMAAMGTGVIGAPVTMTVLALESTGDFSITVGALVASAITALVVRESFGYSFATWRFHLRGETIRGPHDVGWMRDMKVARLMTKDVRTISADLTVAAARDILTSEALKQAVAIDDKGEYVGILTVADVLGTTPDMLTLRVGTLAQGQHLFLISDMNVREAIDMFKKGEVDALAVVHSMSNRQPIGLLTEAHALRRYGEQLERRNRDS